MLIINLWPAAIIIFAFLKRVKEERNCTRPKNRTFFEKNRTIHQNANNRMFNYQILICFHPPRIFSFAVWLLLLFCLNKRTFFKCAEK